MLRSQQSTSSLDADSQPPIDSLPSIHTPEPKAKRERSPDSHTAYADQQVKVEWVESLLIDGHYVETELVDGRHFVKCGEMDRMKWLVRAIGKHTKSALPADNTFELIRNALDAQRGPRSMFMWCGHVSASTPVESSLVRIKTSRDHYTPLELQETFFLSVSFFFNLFWQKSIDWKFLVS